MTIIADRPRQAPPSHEAHTIALLRELVTLNRAILATLERQQRPSAMDDGRPSRLLAALAEAMHDLDLPFDASEVLDHAALDCGLAEALEACGVQTAPALGALFRSLRDRHIDGLMLVRDGRSWRLARCT